MTEIEELKKEVGNLQQLLVNAGKEVYCLKEELKEQNLQISQLKQQKAEFEYKYNKLVEEMR